MADQPPTGTYLDYGNWSDLPSEAQSNYTKYGQQYGMSGQQYFQFLQQNPPQYQSASQGNQYGFSAGGQMQQTPTTAATLNTLAQLNKMGLLGGQQQQGPPTGPVSTDPQDLAANMGAARLGTQAIYNPRPTSSAFDPTSGVQKVPSATVSSGVPTMPAGVWNQVPGIQSAQDMGGIWAQNPTQTTQIAPITPRAAPGSPAATPFATPPQMPTGVQSPIAASTPAPVSGAPMAAMASMMGRPPMAPGGAGVNAATNYTAGASKIGSPGGSGLLPQELKPINTYKV